jgi:hypothetical protein
MKGRETRELYLILLFHYQNLWVLLPYLETPLEGPENTPWPPPIAIVRFHPIHEVVDIMLRFVTLEEVDEALGGRIVGVFCPTQAPN